MSKPFQALPADRPPAEAEAEVSRFWREQQVFKQTLERTQGGEPFVFFEGPPTANGMPHQGHVLTRVIKDLFPRYKTMCGFHVARKAGWDTHGLPVEIEVEKDLGLEGKQDIETHGIADFVAKCKESVWKYKGEWETLTERLGFWIDMDHPYVTYDKSYVESVWWALQQLHQKGLLYKGHKILPWCPRDMTGLSSHEVGQGYLEVEDPAITVAFKLKGQDETYALAWTTTPWTLLSNVALVVHPEIDYAYVRQEERTYLLAQARVKPVLGETAEVLKTVKGQELLGTEYEPLFDFHGELDAPAHRVITANFVTTGDGTGIVHAAPAFGVDDQEACLAHGLAHINLVQPNGRFAPEAGPYAGQWVKDADKGIRKELRDRGVLLKDERTKHDYPHCWRCKTPLLYYAREAWFIRTTQVKDRLVALNQTIAWYPEHIRDGRFGDFLANNKDWALSRERYWGTPLPVWECQAEGCEGKVVVGSVAELREKNPQVPADLDPHRPVVDEVTVPCPDCGGEARRVNEVIDCWFDSGAMPFAQWGYPHLEGSEEKFRQAFPASFISEAIDQTRGWFYTLHAIATLLFDQVSYQRCLVLGHVLDAKGKKLSKKDKNYRSPNAVLDEHGADAFRWFFYSKMTPGQGVRFMDEAVRDARRMFLLKILNVYKFFQEYASSDGFDPRPGGTPRPALTERDPLDRWALSFLQTTIHKVREGLDGYDFHAAALALEEFVEGLSNWYVRRSRPRGWSKATPENTAKWAFWWTTWEVLSALARMLAPFVPHLAEDLHRVLERELLPEHEASVHLCRYPEPDDGLVDAALEAQMTRARRVVNLGLSVRQGAKIKVRQRLGRAVVLCSSADEERDVHALAEVVGEELNVAAVEVSRDFDTYVAFEIKPDFRRLGPRLGKQMGAVGKALKALDAREVAAKVRAGEGLEVAGHALAAEDLDVRLSAREGFAAAEEAGMVVVLDTAITPELVRAGLAREVQNRVQNFRKELDLPFDARVELWVGGAEGDLVQALEENRGALAGEVQADAVHLEPPGAGWLAVPLERQQVSGRQGPDLTAALVEAVQAAAQEAGLSPGEGLQVLVVGALGELKEPAESLQAALQSGVPAGKVVLGSVPSTQLLLKSVRIEDAPVMLGLRVKA